LEAMGRSQAFSGLTCREGRLRKRDEVSPYAQGGKKAKGGREGKKKKAFDFIQATITTGSADPKKLGPAGRLQKLKKRRKGIMSLLLSGSR